MQLQPTHRGGLIHTSASLQRVPVEFDLADGLHADAQGHLIALLNASPQPMCLYSDSELCRGYRAVREEDIYNHTLVQNISTTLAISLHAHLVFHCRIQDPHQIHPRQDTSSMIYTLHCNVCVHKIMISWCYGKIIK